MNEARSLWIQDIEAPDFTTTDINGKTVKLSDFKGNYLCSTFGLHGADLVVTKPRR